MIVQEFLKSTPGAKWEENEAVGDVGCKVITAEAPENIRKMQVEMAVAKVKEASQYGLDKRVDAKESKSTYRVWIGVEDLRIHKITWDLEPKFDLKGMPVPAEYAKQLEQFKASYSLELSKYDEEIDFEIPAEAAKLLK
jgi:hypothetical protein